MVNTVYRMWLQGSIDCSLLLNALPLDRLLDTRYIYDLGKGLVCGPLQAHHSVQKDRIHIQVNIKLLNLYRALRNIATCIYLTLWSLLSAVMAQC